MDLMLKDARVIVTAGAGGIGRAIVDAFLAEGAHVATCDVDESGLNRFPVGVFRRRVDVSDATALSTFVDDAAQELGGIDCLVNNAGIAGPTGRIENLPLEEIQQCMSICLTSQFITTGRAVPHLKQSNNASIINVSSLAGRLGFRLRSPYAAAKWGVIGFTKSMAIELGDNNIRVNAVLPGLVAGDRQRNVLEKRAQAKSISFEDAELDAFSRTSIKEYVTAEQLADQVLFLASLRGRTISGQAISICGDTGMLG
ncbi:MAG: NAD(P)-dependent dehydrogenase (short-subunit alcohol dehydrogenase family) [Yoonia sp.]|jgi:NAD(P)-dependent dehydrogenase (short-subunit alcohol dehydrogenase family)